MSTDGTNYSTLEEMKSYFEKKTNVISDCLKYRPIEGDVAKKLCVIKSAISELSGVFKETRKELIVNKETVLEMQNLLEKVENIMKRLDHMESNFPSVLKKPAAIQEKKTENVLNMVLKENAAPPETKVSKAIAQMAYVTVKEFDAVPKYMKGRLKYEQINKFVDDFNAVIIKKYQLLRQPRKELKPSQLDAVKKLKGQENADTKGFYFGTSDDLKEYGNIRPDKITLSIITVLRHCLKIKEVRSPGVIRYVILN